MQIAKHNLANGLSPADSFALAAKQARAVKVADTTDELSAVKALRLHWPEYLAEAAELALFMISACTFGVLLYHPASPVVALVQSEPLRRLLMGLAMGGTAIAIIFSPLGQRSGAHFNPVVTLTYLRLGKVQRWDAAFYILFQFIGGVAGVMLSSVILKRWIGDASVNYVTTAPGAGGVWPAFFAEFTISFVLMAVVLTVSNTKRLGRWTGIFAGGLVAAYIFFEAPISGMSMNPARTFGSAFGAQMWTALWIYFTAPPLGMLLAAEIFQRVKAGRTTGCAKLNHHNQQRCIFRCNFQA